YAHMGGPPSPGARPGPGFGNSRHFAPTGLSRGFKSCPFGFSRFSPNRFDRFGYNHFGRNQLLLGGGWGWGGWSGYSASAPNEYLSAGGGAPIIINIGVDPGPSDAGAPSGGCVIHKLSYDNAGKYVGERQ